MTPEQFKEALARYYAGTLSPEERGELGQLLHDPGRRQELEALFIEDVGAAVEKELPSETLIYIYQQILDNNSIGAETVRVRRIAPLWRWAAAAVVVLIAAGIYLFRPSTSPVEKGQATAATDIAAPTASRARIMLGNGQQVYLDSVANGAIAQQGEARIVKHADGQVTYEADASHSGAVVINTLVNPRGSRVVDLTLADGTRVWLNVGSSLKYPAVFNGDTRSVDVTGEAYFEAAKDAVHPFFVRKGELTIQVLGTSFNVNTYGDEGDPRVTLLDGSVRVEYNGQSALLHPGEQARMGETVHTTNDIDLETVMAWKNGRFDFRDADVPTVMRQLARWYDVEVIYEGGVPNAAINGQVYRTTTLAGVLKIIHLLGIDYRIEGRKIIIVNTSSH